MHGRTPHFGFSKTMRVRKAGQFKAVYGARTFVHAGPLRVYGRPNGLTHDRLGMSVSRAVGNAVVRNRIKRRLREAFRLLQHDLPPGYDWVVSIRRHEPLEVVAYQQLLTTATAKLERRWSNERQSD